MIRLEQVWKIYPMGEQRFEALRDVSEEIAEGEFIALIGPSGSGKSTLLHIIGCLDQPSRGSYHLDGRDVAQCHPQQLADIRLHELGFIFQAFHLVPRLSALENIELPMIFAGIPRSERVIRAAEALEAVGLSDWGHHRPAELSGGQKQRVAIARATIMHPRLILADEPTGNLDSASGAQVLALLRERNRQGLSVIMVTHDPNVARIADRVIVLRDGAIARRVARDQIHSIAELFAEAPSPKDAAALEGEG